MFIYGSIFSYPQLYMKPLSMTLNFIAIALAITGILNPVVGALVHNAGSVLVIANSAFLLKWKRRSQS